MGLGNLNQFASLLDLGLPLVELGHHVRDPQDGQHVAFLHMVAYVHVPFLHVTGNLGDDRGLLVSLDIGGLLNAPLERGTHRADHGNFGNFCCLDGVEASGIPRCRSKIAQAGRQRFEASG